MKSLGLIPVLLLIASCANTRVTEPVVIDSSCNWAKVIFVSNQDVLTDGTARQVLSHNVLVQKNCPK